MSRFKTSFGSVAAGVMAVLLSPEVTALVPVAVLASLTAVPAGISPEPESCQAPFSCRITSPTFSSNFCLQSADSIFARPGVISVTV